MRVLVTVVLTLALGLTVVGLAGEATPPSGRLVIVVAALATWLGAMAGFVALTGARFSELRGAGVILWGGLFAGITLLSAGLTLLITGGDPWWPALAAGLSVAALVFGGSSLLWLVPMRTIYALRPALRDPARRLETLSQLLLSFTEEPRPRGGIRLRREAHRALAAARVLSELRLWREALQVLDTIAIEPLDPPRRAAVQACRATYLLYLQERDAAYRALKDAQRHAQAPLLRQVLSLTDALQQALDGHGDDALRMTTVMGRPEHPNLRRAWHITRCHALAATGDEEAARRELSILQQIAEDGLERVMELQGPASALAQTMLEGA